MIPGIVAQASTGQSPASMPHRYWRVFIVSNNGQANTSIGEIEMYSSALDGAARKNRAVGGTASAISNNPGETAAMAFDNSNAGIWAATGTSNLWIKYDFGSGNDIVIDRFTLKCRSGGFQTQAPNTFRLEFSDDDTNWSIAFQPSAQASWATNEQRLFVSPSYVAPSYSGSPHGTHRYWRLHFSRDNNGGENAYSAAEVEMRATPAGADQCSGGTASAHSVFGSNPGANDAAKAFDNNTATLWSASGSSTNGWLQYDFGSGNAVAVAEIMLQARNDASFTQTGRWGCVEFSDDGSEWSTAWEYAMASTYSAGLAQTSTDPAYV